MKRTKISIYFKKSFDMASVNSVNTESLLLQLTRASGLKNDL